MNQPSFIVLAAMLTCAAPAFVQANTLAYDDGELRQHINVINCQAGEGCAQKLVTSGNQSFVYNFGNFDALDAWLTAFTLETTVYDAGWEPPMESDAHIKVNGVLIATEKFRRDCASCKKRRRKDPKGTANTVYSYAKAGDVIEVIFQPVEAPVTANNFTVNFKRFSNETLIKSQSHAWYSPSDGGGGTTIIQ